MIIGEESTKDRWQQADSSGASESSRFVTTERWSSRRTVFTLPIRYQ